MYYVFLFLLIAPNLFTTKHLVIPQYLWFQTIHHPNRTHAWGTNGLGHPYFIPNRIRYAAQRNPRSRIEIIYFSG